MEARYDMRSDEFQEFLDEAVEEEATGLWGPPIDAPYSSAFDDAYNDIRDELESHNDQGGKNSITESEARECIRCALLHHKQVLDDESEAMCEDY